MPALLGLTWLSLIYPYLLPLPMACATDGDIKRANSGEMRKS